jgi:predicted metal-dependent hydrolase
MPTLQFGNTNIDYDIRYSPNRKNITISVDWVNGVSVMVPNETEQAFIELAVQKKAPWIMKKLANFREIKMLSSHREFISGEKIPYLGRQYRLKVMAVEDVLDMTLAFQNGRFIATVPKTASPSWRQEHLRKAFHDWYIVYGLNKVQQRIKLFAPRLGVMPSKVIIKDQQARWGSCTKKGTININWRILMAPMRIVDYVVVHELAHMIHADHSSDFWAVVSSIMPDYDARKDWLRVHGATLQL